MMETRAGAVTLPSTAALLCAAWLLALRPPSAAALWLTLPPVGTKCVSEEIQAGVVSLAEYSVVFQVEPHPKPTVFLKVTSPTGNTLHHKENATTGQFGFTTTEPGAYKTCFWMEGANENVGASVTLNWKIGIAVQDLASIAKKENIEGVELGLSKLEMRIRILHNNILYRKASQGIMNDLGERTNSRVAMFSMISIGVCIVSSGLQLWHLKRFFVKKKLI
ncbi:hypothetical protein Cni_G06398 [Canna indica]|uniref:GOLD domain-containing protein n=1 Tax=Canna indica TaxID=4628 RepID=A0AAQ3Q5W5_9LILI|nr:hypothetical protein Cni_G06398 [Canna indica]